ncbi:hypothetical protein LTS18_002433, partial [Coniosporium uncinatum]
MGDSNPKNGVAITDKDDPSRDGDGTSSSIASSPEAEAEAYPQQDVPQQQKRKGGRKP